MPLTTSQQLIRETAKRAFWQEFEGYPDILPGISMRTDSNSDQEVYPSITAVPGPREMVGDRVAVPAPAQTQTILNKKWESTVPIAYELWRFARLGQIEVLSRELASKAAAYPSKLVSELMNDGDATACIDGQFFYDTDHVDPGGTYSTSQSNDISYNAAATTALTVPEAAGVCRAAINALHGFVDAFGDPVVPRPDTVFEVHTPSAYLTSMQALEKTTVLSSSEGNDMLGRVRVVHNPWLDAVATDPTVYVHNPMGARKPFIFQVADPVSYEDNMDTDASFRSKDVQIGSFGYYNVGYGEWRTSVKVTIT